MAKTGYGRVAILQYDFLDSYSAEKFPTYRVESEIVKLPRVVAGAVEHRLSFEEHRRRQVLAAVMVCCEDFGVEALVIPEYSLWPETINWLEKLCREQAYKVSIWAGTFRQQPGFALALADQARFIPVSPTDRRADILPMEAILSVLFRETQPAKPLHVREVGAVNDEGSIFNLNLPERLHYRRKKYPSIGMNEEFRPKNEDMNPLMMTSRSLNRIESFVSELVCSELFVFNGPLNWVNFSDHLSASTIRYNLGKVDWIDAMVVDSRAIAQAFSGVDSRKPRRSILFLTCQTSRDADYHYFAQSAYLASGIVTAFCNSSQKPSRGGSCFVGPGGWETEGGRVAPNPYHGAAPGILSLASPYRGVLGVHERALVIADIRPERTVEDRPRTQTLRTPMRLVAHIPILEDHSCTPVTGQWDRRWWRPKPAYWLTAALAEERLDEAAMHDLLMHQAKLSSISLDDLAHHLTQLLEDSSAVGSTERLSDQERDRLIAAALSLSATFEKSPGMRNRASSMVQGLREQPEALPCPALLDWLVVELAPDQFEVKLRQLASLCGEHPVLAETLPAELRDGPWRWIAPENKKDPQHV